MKKLVWFLLLSFCSIAVWASGTASGTSAARKGPPSADPFNATKTMKCVIVQLKNPNLVLLEDPDTGEKQPYRLSERIRLRAKNKADFDGRKKLTFADLAIGQTVKVSINSEKREVTSLKVIQISSDNS